MKIRFMALFLSAFFSLIMLMGCAKDDIEKVDISGMQPEEIFELYKEDLISLEESFISFDGKLLVYCKDNKLDALSFSEDEMAFIDMSMNSDKAKELEEIMVMLNSDRIFANYYNENSSDAPFEISFRVDKTYGEYFCYYPENVLPENLIPEHYNKFYSLGDGWYYKQLLVIH